MNQTNVTEVTEVTNVTEVTEVHEHIHNEGNPYDQQLESWRIGGHLAEQRCWLRMGYSLD